MVSAMADGGPSRKRPAPSSSPKLEVDVLRHAEAWRPALNDALLKRAARAAFLTAPPPGHGIYEVTILLTDDAEMWELNRAWRGKDAPTNVLSFPASDQLAEPGPLGDVVLAAETVLAEAADRNVPAADHAAHLVVHGMLHLLGFHHERNDEAAAMEALETKVLSRLGIADPYETEAEVSP